MPDVNLTLVCKVGRTLITRDITGTDEQLRIQVRWHTEWVRNGKLALTLKVDLQGGAHEVCVRLVGVEFQDRHDGRVHWLEVWDE